MFITIYEGLCGETIPDLVQPAKTEEAHIHNMQCVIDSLAMDILHTSLSHITGQDVVRKRRMSIINLLDIFSGLLEYILDGIAKEDQLSEGGEVTRETDVVNQSTLSDALRKGIQSGHTGSIQRSSDDNTDDLIALGDDKYLKTPTASPSSKKSRRSDKSERRRSSRVTPQAVSQPVANSSMQSIQPSATESESDASVKPSTGRALQFSKVPAEYSPPFNSKGKPLRDTTFTKPDVPPEKTISQKLGEEILRTGDSTEELIALADTPRQRMKTRSSTRTLEKALTIDKPATTLAEGDAERNKTNNAKTSRPTKRGRVAPKRHVSFINDKTTVSDNTVSDVSSAVIIPRRTASHGGEAKHRPPTASPGREDISMRLVEFFNRKETAGDGGHQHLTLQDDDKEQLSPEYKATLAKTSSLYDRVTALRNAASEKLDSLRQSTSASDSADYMTANAHLNPQSGDKSVPGAITREECQVRDNRVAANVLSDYARSKLRSDDRNSTTERSEDFVTARENSDFTTDYKTADTDHRVSHYPVGDGALPRHSRGRVHITAPDSGDDTITDSTANYKTAIQSNISEDLPSDCIRRSSTNRYSTASELASKPTEYRTATLASDNLYKTAELRSDTESALAHESLPESRRDKALESLGYERPEWRSLLSAPQKGKRVRFNKSKTTSTAGMSRGKPARTQTMFEAVKKTLDEEKWQERIQHKLLTKQYRDDLDDMVEAHRERLQEEKEQAQIQDKNFMASVQKLTEAYGDKPRKAQSAYKPRGYLLPKTRVLRKRITSKNQRETSDGENPSQKPLDPNDENFIPNLMEEFPHLYLAPETIKKMWNDHQQQTSTIKKCLAEDRRKKTKAKSTIEDAEKRQAILMNIMKKELDHTKRMKQRRDKENVDTENKRKERDVRQQSARVRKYYDDYALRMKSSMMKNKTREEQLFKKLFAEGLKVQKERMQTLRSYAKEQRESRARQQQVDVEALETFYKDQFAMLAESVAQEKKNVEIRDDAQAKVLDKMKRELRKKMERDIVNFQDQLKRDEDDYYYRQLDAEKVVQQLNMTRYQTGI